MTLQNKWQNENHSRKDRHHLHQRKNRKKRKVHQNVRQEQQVHN